MLRSLVLFAVLVLPAAAGEPPMLAVPAEVHGEPGDFLQVAAATPSATVEWYVLDAGLKLFPSALLKDTRTAVVIATKPGRYRLLAWTAKGDNPSKGALCTVIIGGDQPPEPAPDPNPGPAPGPFSAAKLYVLVVKEANDDRPDFVRLVDSPSLRSYLTGRGHVFRVYEDSQEVMKPYLPWVQKTGLPALILIDNQVDKGKVRRAVKLPATEADIKKEITAAGGV